MEVTEAGAERRHSPRKRKTSGKRILEGAVSGFFSTGFTFAQTVVQVPILLHFWGKTTYGHWMAIVAAQALILTLDSGHQSYVGNKINLAVQAGGDEVKRTVGSAMRMAVVLGGIELLLAIGAVLFGFGSVVLGLDPNDPGRFWTEIGLIVIIAKSWLVGSIGGVLMKVYTPYGDFARSQWWGVKSRIMYFLSIMLGAALGWSLFQVVLFSSIVMAAKSLIAFRDIRNRYPWLSPWFSEGSWSEGWRNVSRSLFLTGGNFLQQGSSNGVVLATSQLAGAAMIPALTTIRTLANSFVLFSNVTVSPLLPDFARCHVQKNWQRLYQLFTAIWLVNGIPINLGMVVVYPFIPWLYRMWTRGALEFNAPLFAASAVAVAIGNLGSPIVNYVKGVNMLGLSTSMAAARCVITVGGAVVLLPRIGLAGVGFALVAAEIISSLLIPLLAVHRMSKLTGAQFPVKSLLGASGAVLITVSSFSFYLYVPSLTLAVQIAAPALLVIVGFFQWSWIAPDIRSRIVGMLPFRKKTAAPTP